MIILLPSTFRNLDNNRIKDIQDGAFDGLNDLLEMYVLKLATVPCYIKPWSFLRMEQVKLDTLSPIKKEKLRIRERDNSFCFCNTGS